MPTFVRAFSLCRARRRFKELVEYGYFSDCKLYRVVPGFITQWGIPKSPSDYQKFGENKIKDDPVRQSNLAGTVTFATSEVLACSSKPWRQTVASIPSHPKSASSSEQHVARRPAIRNTRASDTRYAVHAAFHIVL